MTMIAKLDEIITVEVLTYPGKRDIFKEPQQQHVQIPGTFLMGEKWYLTHTCKQCGNNVEIRQVDIEYKDSGWFFMSFLSWRSIRDIQLLDEIGALFGLNISTDFDGEQPGSFRYYSLTGIFKGMALIAYYQCPHCKSQYLMTFMHAFAQNERSAEPDEMYVEKIYQVRFDHDTFMKRVKK
ncbi:hypothetical protein F0L74_21040 [Chitinophaga agrisoli]|uniref:Uncharacterized protein n=1 Tax=Chitinophaga agrisoli TaxID=2607653 RepID=A0A5B2VKD4_9BACT|nr:hypothetical protein [Chitinophaga agrisoli]KAA2238707.1 hypothetical protein F0L74_21040 [Chitinophaga agrisoli]